MNRAARKVLLGLGALCLIGSVVITYKILIRAYFAQSDIHLATDFLVEPDRKDIPGNGLLLVDKDKQFVSLVLYPGFIPAYHLGVRAPDGELIGLDVVLIAADETRYPLNCTSSTNPRFGGGYTIKCTYLTGFNFFPKGMVFKAVELKSDKPITLKTIYWSGYNIEDQK